MCKVCCQTRPRTILTQIGATTRKVIRIMGSLFVICMFVCPVHLQRKVLLPSEVAKLSNMTAYEGKAVVLSYRDEKGQMLLYVGTVRVRTDGKGVLEGKRLAGEDHGGLVQPVGCVLDEVKSVKGISAAGYGECTFSGDGHIDISLDIARVFTGSGVLVPADATDIGSFKGLNAATYATSGNYEAFAISEANATHISGQSYFSTRLETWTTDFADGKKHVEACSIFVDVSSCQRKYWHMPHTHAQINKMKRGNCMPTSNPSGRIWHTL